MIAILPSLLRAPQIAGGFPSRALAFLVGTALKGTIFLLLAALFSLALRRRSAAVRHLAWTLSLFAILALPVFSLVGPRWDVLPIPASPAVSDKVQPAAESAAATATPGSPVIPVPATQPLIDSASARYPAWPFWCLFVWAIGSMLLAARIAVGEFQARRFARRAKPLQSGAVACVLDNVRARLRLPRTVDLRASPHVTIPLTVGWFRAVVILPEEARRWSANQLEFVLAHELAHAKRYDCLTQALAQIVCAVFWPHPLVWLASARMRKERERACDDAVLNLGHAAPDYAEFLLMLGRGLKQRTPQWSAGTAMVHSSQLEVRMKALLDRRLSHRPLTGNRVLLAAMLAVALLLPVAAIRATGQGSTVSISGIVRDPSGGVIPSASVTLTNLDTHQKASARTGPEGTFKFSSLPAGRYQIEVRQPGFRLSQSRVFELKPSENIGWEDMMQLGRIAQTMTVTGHRTLGPPLINPKTGKPVRIRVGGNVEAAKLIHAVHPVYPRIAERSGYQGTVVLEATIGKDGSIQQLGRVSGPPLLVQAAINAVRQWRYTPTYLNGRPVEVETSIDIVFRLTP